MDITIRVLLLHTILFELPLLAIVSEVYFRRTQPRPDLDEGRRRLKAKIDLVRTVERELDFRISDFGTRRRFSMAWHEEVLQTLKGEVPEYFAGTSNVWFAMRNNLTPLGTMAHEYMQACQALGPRLRDSQTFAFDVWAQEYRGDLGIAVADSYGTNLTNDLGYEPINIVIKMTECNGQPVAKVSDSPGKTVSKDAGYLRYLRQVFGLEPAEKI